MKYYGTPMVDDGYVLLEDDQRSVYIDEVFDLGMEVASRFFETEAAASTFVIKHQGGIRQATRFGLLRTHAIEMFEQIARQYVSAREFAKPWQIGAHLTNETP